MDSDTLKQWLPLAAQFVGLVVIPLVGWSVNKWLMSKASMEQRELVAQVAAGAYQVVQQIARKTPGELDDLLVEQAGHLVKGLASRHLPKKLILGLSEIEREIGRRMKPRQLETAITELRALHERGRLAGSLNLADLPRPENASRR